MKNLDCGVSGQLISSVSNCLSWMGTVTYMSPARIKRCGGGEGKGEGEGQESAAKGSRGLGKVTDIRLE